MMTDHDFWFQHGGSMAANFLERADSFMNKESHILRDILSISKELLR